MPVRPLPEFTSPAQARRTLVDGEIRGLCRGRNGGFIFLERPKAVRGSQILVLGVAYKKDVRDIRESPALDSPVPICPKILCSRWATTEFSDRFLEEKGAKASYHDSHVPAFQHEGMVVVTDHRAYEWSTLHNYQDRLVDTRHLVST